MLFGNYFSLSFLIFISLPSSLYSVILVSSSAVRFKLAINLLLICTIVDPQWGKDFFATLVFDCSKIYSIYVIIIFIYRRISSLSEPSGLCR